MLRKRVVRNPRKEITGFIVTLVVIVAVFFAVLNYFVSLQQPPTSSAELTVGSLRYSLEMPRTQYTTGDPVDVRLTVRDIGNRPVVLSFDRQLEFDVIVQKNLNLLFATVPLDIWKYSVTRPSLRDAHQVTLKPGQNRVYETKWPQVDSRGDAVGPGRYLITGVVNLAGGQQRALQIQGNMQ